MAFEQYKTQVLLLHSEQSTLDVLSRGFNDRYAVHCATSGTEALNTLGVTPIHVIVSAQDLPGMSGLDALREAKKRSPETITILMTGTDAGDGLEALVSDKEVFQVIRGEISPDALAELVESATRTARLTALSESANDTSADVDEPGENIVMETAENGSFVFSDGTGQVPALKPEKVGTLAIAGTKRVDVLVLTQDDEFLDTIKESARGTHHVHHASKPGQAEDFVRNFPVGVLVTDAALAGSKVEALTQRIRSHQQRLVAIVAGRRDDGEMLMDLINRGHVYRFLLKPVSPGRARLAVEASVRHHLEAPDHSFADRPTAKTAKLPPADPAAPEVSRPDPKAVKNKAAADAAARKPAPAPQKPPARSASADSPVSDGLEDAFGEARSFTETMTGIAVSVGKSLANAASGFKSAKKDAPPKKPAAVPEQTRASMPKVAADASTSKPAPAPAAATEARTPAKKPEPATAPQRRVAPTISVPPRTTVAAADRDGEGPSGLMSAKVMGIAATVVVALGLGAFLFSGGDDSPVEPIEDPTPQIVESREAIDEPAPIETSASDGSEAGSDLPQPAELQPTTEAGSLLAQARDARAAGDIYAPAGHNAVEFYLAAGEADPANAEIAAELAALVEEVYGLAETALLENRATAASRALRVLGLADAENPRLSFLTVQLSQQQLRNSLDNARVAIREGRFEDAEGLLARAESIAGSSTGEIDALTADLAAARSEQQLGEVLALAGERLADDRLIEPSNDNARYFFELARTIDPDSTAVQQGLLTVASKLVLRARTAIDAGDLATAGMLLDNARALDPDSNEAARATTALGNAINAAPAADASVETDDEPVAEMPANAAAAADPAAEYGAIAGAEAAPAAANEPHEAGAEIADDGAAPPTAAATAAARAADAAPADDSGSDGSGTASETSAPAEASAADETVSISALKRIEYVPPNYPRSAQRRNQSGFVDVAFTVNAAGEVIDVEVRDSDPGDVFVDSAVEAVEQWRFEPVVENGQPASKRVAVRMSFNLQ